MSMGNYCPYTVGNVVYLQCKECEEKLCEKDWFFCGVAGTPLSMKKSRKQMSECIDKMLAKREKVVIAAESGKKMAALAAMYASERGYSFIPVANDDLPTYLAKQQQKHLIPARAPLRNTPLNPLSRGETHTTTNQTIPKRTNKPNHPS